MRGAMSLAAISYDPIVRLHIGPLSISPHGVGIALGFLVGAALMLPATRREGMRDDDVYIILTLAAIGALLGARVAFVINHPGHYESVGEALRVWHGGISLLGGIVGAILLALPRMRSCRLSFWKVMDAAAPGLALGLIVGRTGDLIVADHLGKVTTFFLGYRCPALGVETASPCAAPGALVHHTALYDLVGSAVLLAALLHLRRQARYDGFLICVFGALYCSLRIIEDFLRDDIRRFGLTGSQWTSAVAIALCLFVLVVRRGTPRWGNWDVDEVRGVDSGSSDRRDVHGQGDRGRAGR